jgi:PEP-CTERM motif
MEDRLLEGFRTFGLPALEVGTPLTVGGLHMRKSLRTLAAFPVLFLFLGCAQNVFASSVTFDFTISGVGITGSGNFTATLLSGNQYLVTAINGMQNGTAMTLLVPGAYAVNDNNIFSSAPFLSTGGLAFELSGPPAYNVYFDPGVGYFECSSALTPCHALGSGTPVQFSLTQLSQVPEPGTLMLLGSGLLGLAGIARRKLLG